MAPGSRPLAHQDAEPAGHQQDTRSPAVVRETRPDESTSWELKVDPLMIPYSGKITWNFNPCACKYTNTWSIYGCGFTYLSYPRELKCKNFQSDQSAKIFTLENFMLYYGTISVFHLDCHWCLSDHITRCLSTWRRFHGFQFITRL